jgi:hypothetical protein
MRQGLALGALSASLAVLAAGCAQLQPESLATPGPAVPPPPPPPVSDFAWSTAPGSNAIHGEIAYVDRTGRKWACAGQSVALMPRTPSTDLRMQTLYGSAQRALEPVANVRAHSGAVRGPDPGPYVRTSTCDPHSRFVFEGLPNGGYFLIARVHVENVHLESAHGDGGAGVSEEGLAVMQKVELTGGVTRQLVLPLRNRP